MPEYDYKCTACGQSFCFRQTMAEQAFTTHPTCNDPKCCLEKQVSPFYSSVASRPQSSTLNSAYNPRITANTTEQAIIPQKPAETSHICSKYCDYHKS